MRTFTIAFVLLSLASFAGGSEYGEQRALADKQAENPAVKAYREQVGKTVDAALSAAFLHCTARELYSRRAYPTLVLTVEADGTVTRVQAEIYNRMGRCGVNSVTALKLPPPPVAPLQLAFDSPAH
jgi:Glu-tRNA(Gln) amidotransferase subunit E-like FAD-binding protein